MHKWMNKGGKPPIRGPPHLLKVSTNSLWHHYPGNFLHIYKYRSPFK